MPPVSVRSLLYSALAVLSVTAACFDSTDVGSELLDPIGPGVSKDSLLAVMGKGPLTGRFADTLRLDHGFRVNRYLVKGQTFEVLFYRELAGDVSEPVSQEDETPVVLKDGKVLGWGWRFYVDEAIGKLGLPTPLVENVQAAPVPSAAPQPGTPRPEMTRPEMPKAEPQPPGTQKS